MGTQRKSRRKQRKIPPGKWEGQREMGTSFSLSGRQGQLEKNLAGHGKISEFYLKDNGKPLKGFQRGKGGGGGEDLGI